MRGSLRVESTRASSHGQVLVKAASLTGSGALGTSSGRRVLKCNGATSVRRHTVRASERTNG
eukprot:scaffold2036_cov202-Prasinococcus_capsulatus_cf.AAC.2